MKQEQRSYYAFISYKREDKKEAKKLQHIMKQLFFILAAVLCLVGCNTEEPTRGSYSGGSTSTNVFLSVSPQQITYSGAASSVKYINIECNTHWEIKLENKDMFQMVSPMYGDGNKKVSVFFPEIDYYEQNSFVTQYGSITVSCKNEKGETISSKVNCTRKK